MPHKFEFVLPLQSCQHQLSAAAVAAPALRQLRKKKCVVNFVTPPWRASVHYFLVRLAQFRIPKQAARTEGRHSIQRGPSQEIL